MVLLFGSAAGAQIPGLDGDQQRTVTRWLTCNDCLAGQLDSVRALASLKPEATVDTLRRALVVGAPDTMKSRLAAAMRRTYSRDSAYARTQALTVSLSPRDSMVNRALAAFDATWRQRAAEALGYINTARSDSALDTALTLTLPLRVLRTVRFAKDSLP